MERRRFLTSSLPVETSPRGVSSLSYPRISTSPNPKTHQLHIVYFCQFYRTYPIANSLRSQLNWTQYRRLIQIEDHDKREYYELESVNNNWTARETERQINSQLYERLLLSNDKESVLAY